MKSRLQKMFPGGLEKYELRCSNDGCDKTYRVTELAAARAHQNFNVDHTIIVYHAKEGGIGRLECFSRIRG